MYQFSNMTYCVSLRVSSPLACLQAVEAASESESVSESVRKKQQKDAKVDPAVPYLVDHPEMTW